MIADTAFFKQRTSDRPVAARPATTHTRELAPGLRPVYPSRLLYAAPLRAPSPGRVLGAAGDDDEGRCFASLTVTT